MNFTRRTILGSIGIGLVGTAGCAGAPSNTDDPDFAITTTAFDEGDTIPDQYTCTGADGSPPLSIEGVPDDAESIGIMFDDPDAPGTTFTHWLLWNVPARVTAIPANVPMSDTVASLDGAAQGRNDFGSVGYRGPCPPEGDDAHTYRFRAYALDEMLDEEPGAGRNTVQKAFESSAVAHDTLTGTFGR